MQTQNQRSIPETDVRGEVPEVDEYWDAGNSRAIRRVGAASVGVYGTPFS